ncbi:MAG TPA: class I SAM-dependent methyltransferase, partial [Verrucomicrobiales bacterium]|nr:class I SAM-dependent methyltransferase [Verrucomicrobiales bacterium]
LAYYGARAAEYDQWWLRQGRYNRGAEETARWFREAAELDAALDAFQPAGDILELACGTGLRSGKLLAAADRLTVVDGSAEMLAIHAERFGAAPVERIQADLFDWSPPRRFDVVYFGFWLSHVPPDRFAEFWVLVERALKPDGRFFFVDSRRTPDSTAVDHVLPDEGTSTMIRRLDDGREFRVFKVFYDPRELEMRLAELAWDCQVGETGTYFIHGHGARRAS